MNLLQKTVKILIQIGSPLLGFFKLLIKFFQIIGKINFEIRFDIKFKKRIKKNRIKILLKKINFSKRLDSLSKEYSVLKNKVKNFKFKRFNIKKSKIKKSKINKVKIKKFNIKALFKKRKKLEEQKEVTVSLKKKAWIPITISLFLIIGSVYFYVEILKDLPNVNLIYRPPNLSTRILDRNGEVLYKFYQDENRTWVDLEKIPNSLIEATLSIEDKNFYQHYGISLKGMVQAVVYNFKKDLEDKPRGGSTITQQLVKNVFFSNEKTLKRKVKEAVLTLEIESKLSKDEILERYLNQVPYGGEAYGVEEAAQKYFGKHVWELDLNQSSYLAGLPAAPSSYSPYGNNPDLGLKRQEMVLKEMVANGYLNEEIEEKTKEEKLEIKENNKVIKAPHFVFYVREWLEKKGYTNFERQGLLIKTSLDLTLQKKAQEIVKNEVEKNRRLNMSNGAALVIDVKSGDILAMVGSVNYYSEEIDGKYNVTTALRQPGSSIKPINYLLALQNDFSLASVIDDSPVVYRVEGQPDYKPRNYNGKYMGQVTLRTALASSLNVPSVKLLEKNGVSEMINLAEKMGISTWNDRKRFGLSLALGSGEVKMIEMAEAYSIFANLGEKVEINPIMKIENYLGEEIYKKDIEKKSTIKAEYAYMINSVLSDDRARSPIFGRNSKLVIPNKTVAVKTGTTNNLKDNWCIGWTPEFLVASWVGNNSGETMSWVASGISGATPIWNQITELTLADRGNDVWEIPNNLVKKNICGKEEWFLAGSRIKINCPKKEEDTENLAIN